MIRHPKNNFKLLAYVKPDEKNDAQNSVLSENVGVMNIGIQQDN